MSKGLTIGASGFSLPLDLATGSIAILAIKGSGKSYTSAVLTEELIGHQVPVTIIDPTGVHWGLKSSADGKREGFPVTILGGDHQDLPLEEGSGEVVARWLVERRFCCILDLSHFRKGQIYRFLTPFLETLYRLNRKPMHLVCDEADTYAPQKSYPDVARCLGAMEDIVRRGRSRGIGTTLITQRPASLNKDVLTQCDCLMALRISHPRDMQPINEWVSLNGDRANAEKMMASLADLPTGTAWVWAPRADIFERVQIRRRQTFDSSSTPKIGEKRIEPTVFAKIDLAALGQEITATVERAKENDPRELKTRISKLQGELGKLEAAAKLKAQLPAKVEVKEVPVLTDQERKEITKLHQLTQSLADKAQGVLDKVAALLAAVTVRQKPAMAEAKPQSVRPLKPSVMPELRPMGITHHEPAEPATIGKCELAILRVLAGHPEGCEIGKIALLAGYRISGTFRNSLGALRSDGSIEGGNVDRMRITEAGQRHGPFTQLPEGDELRSYWLNHPSFGKCEREIR